MGITVVGESKNGQCQITAAELIDPRFSDVPQPAFELMLTVRNEESEEDVIYLEVSNRYGQGNNAQKTQAQMTMETLSAIGWKHGADFSQIGTLVNKVIGYHAKKNAKGYVNVYISTFSAKRISAADVAARVAAMTGGAPAPVAAAVPVAAPAAAANPFGGGAAAAPAAGASNPFGGGAAAPAANPFG